MTKIVTVMALFALMVLFPACKTGSGTGGGTGGGMGEPTDYNGSAAANGSTGGMIDGNSETGAGGY